jgi:hypothetical protein
VFLFTPLVYSQSQKFDVIQIVYCIDEFIWCMSRAVAGTAYQTRYVAAIAKMSCVKCGNSANRQGLAEHILSCAEKNGKQIMSFGVNVRIVIVKERKLGSMF